MKLVSFTVENFRSITKAHKLPIDRSMILLGPNNEGKSNILMALVAAMRVLTDGNRKRTLGSGRTVSRFTVPSRSIYDWERDFPIEQQDKKPNGCSVLVLEFLLDDQENQDFKRDIKSTLNGTLPLRIALGSGPSNVEIEVCKQGRGAKSLTAKSIRIADFVSERLDFDYIPAVRTAESAHEIVDMLVERELASIENDPAYHDALAQIKKLQEPILNRLSLGIHSTLVTFLPNVKEVKIEISSSSRSRALRGATEILVNDGTQTNLRYKGDGVQSLAALGIMRHASDYGSRGKNLIIAIEEPESHLHPNAIHAVREVIQELAAKHQIVVTTHCPLFVDRTRVKSNIIVQHRQAKPAQSIEQIRKCLGVRASDNLRSAELVLVVEGEDDRIVLQGLLPKASSLIREALQNGLLAIDTLSGGSNLAYVLGMLRDSLCVCHCFIDDDAAGKDGFEKARQQSLLTDGDVNFTTCSGMPEAEFEDLFDVEAYRATIETAYRIQLTGSEFRNSQKWSNRMKQTFRAQGKQWSDRIEAEVKMKVAEVVAAANLDAALNTHKRSAFDALVETLNTRLRDVAEA